MDRRTFVGALAGSLVVTYSAASAQMAVSIRRIGYLSSGSNAATQHIAAAFRQALRELGWVEGQNVIVDYRYAEGNYDRLPSLVEELVRLKVEVIVAGPTPPALAAKKATRTVPIVIWGITDPVAIGLVASLARPGGNVTGLTLSVGTDFFGKDLQLLKEVVPKIQRYAVMSNPTNSSHAIIVSGLKTAARSLGVSLQLVEVRSPGELDSAFAAMAKERAEALVVVPDSMFSANRARLAELATANRLPSISGIREYVEAGSLMSYGPNLAYQLRQAAGYVDKILKGAKPADLPVEQPTKYEMVINLKTAKALGLTIPQSLLLRADEVIQ
jgi:putative ABC transport system substrate-binding protein